ncbi:unnamed protein product, partial [Mesorhabditis belari]|uniref:Methyltransferase domain-containing protein n=1 Tax=Mesorhabditis belari TaxID=2138241 RepID=A0AAF3FGV3_9BILA
MTTGVYNNMNACGPLPTVVADAPEFNNCSTTCCPTEGIWGAWTNVGVLQLGGQYGNLSCGMCASQSQSRKCLSSVYGCSCTGSTTQTVQSTETICAFPNPTCCSPYIKKIDTVKKLYTCQLNVTVTPTPIQTTTCCPPAGTGLWNDWSSWSTCSATCGLCGTQTSNRTCASAAYGCPCTGSSTKTQACGQIGCTTGSACCAGTYQAVAYDGTIFCQTALPATCTGTWQPWFNTSSCNDTCGMCGVQSQARYCMPPGCQCSGLFTQQIGISVIYLVDLDSIPSFNLPKFIGKDCTKNETFDNYEKTRLEHIRQAPVRRRVFQEMDMNTQPPIFYNALAIEVLCPSKLRIGVVGDGGKWVCNPWRLPDNCTIYSLGINGQIDFETDVQKITKNRCRVYGYDLAEQIESIKREYESINGELKAGGIFKIDIEGGESKVLPEFVKVYQPCQILVETHQEAAETYKILKSLSLTGLLVVIPIWLQNIEHKAELLQQQTELASIAKVKSQRYTALTKFLRIATNVNLTQREWEEIIGTYSNQAYPNGSTFELNLQSIHSRWKVSNIAAQITTNIFLINLREMQCSHAICRLAIGLRLATTVIGAIFVTLLLGATLSMKENNWSASQAIKYNLRIALGIGFVELPSYFAYDQMSIGRATFIFCQFLWLSTPLCALFATFIAFFKSMETGLNVMEEFGQMRRACEKEYQRTTPRTFAQYYN